MFCHENLAAPSTERVTEFVDATDSYVCEVESEMDSTRYATADPAATLAGFFERPVLISTLDWAVGLGVDSVLSPWYLWMQNKRVANRLTNYKNFKGKLHLKFMLNGNPFYWGRAFVSMTPHHVSPFVKYEDNLNGVMPALQRPHIWLDPASSQGGEMVLPFFYNDDCYDLVGLVNDLGQIWIKSLGVLEHVNNLTSPIRINVFAWCTDVDLTSPTQVNIGGLVPQSGEYSQGAISKPANVVAAMAGKLSRAPIIGPYALATQTAANAVGSLASMFGYSRPRQLESITSVRLNQTGDLASTDQLDSAVTLAFTSKQEVTIDPRVTGLGGVDEMSFEHLNAIPSYFGRTQWKLADTLYQPLMSIGVTPMLTRRSPNIIPVSTDATICTTTAFTAMPFDYWRGSMTYRFQVVSSGFHRGRLLVVWDPLTAAATPEVNTVYSKIIDIADEKDFSITIGWGSTAAFNRTEVVRAWTPTPNVTFRGLQAGADGVLNGVLTLYVLNDLVTSGANTADVDILAFSSSTDMHYFDPNSNNIKFTTFTAQSGFLPQSGVIDPGTSADAPTEPEELGTVGGNQTMGVIGFACGEEIPSFRTCMKRYTQARFAVCNASVPPVSIGNFWFYDDAYFRFRNQFAGIESMCTIQAYGYNAYAGWRGATRVKVFPRATTDPNVSPSIGRQEGGAPSAMTFVSGPLNLAQIGTYMKDFDQSWSGKQMANHKTGQVCDIEMPYYSARRFLYPQSTLAASRAVAYIWQQTVLNPTAAAQAHTSLYDVYQAIGEDFNLFFFLGAPPMWRIS